MTPGQAQEFADAWHQAVQWNWTTQRFAVHLGVNLSNVYRKRREVEAILNITLPTMLGADNVRARERYKNGLAGFPSEEPKPSVFAAAVAAVRELEQVEVAPIAFKPGPRHTVKHYIVPDLQLRKGVPMDHLPWIGQDIVRRKPDVIVLLGDVWDMPSLSSHDAKGSLTLEGARYEDDIKAGNEGMALLMAPVMAAMGEWNPRRIYCEGNHEYRIIRAIEADPRYGGIIGPHHCNVERYGFERHNFLEVVSVDDVNYSHYFQMAGSDRPISGSMDNRLNKICATFVQGHQQGLLQHPRELPIGKRIYGIVAGSAYLHSEAYRGPQRNNEWRGVVVLHDVRNGGNCDPMALTLQYLAEEYAGVNLHDYMAEKYPNLPRGWAR